jgi:hypothetical protein
MIWAYTPIRLEPRVVWLVLLAQDDNFGGVKPLQYAIQVK